MNSTKTLAFIILTYCISTISAQTPNQNFAPIGSQWCYPFSDQNGNPECVYYRYLSVKDTLIQNKNCRKLDIYEDNLYLGAEYVHSDSHKVYYYYDSTQTFHTLYDFTAKVDDTVEVHSSAFKTGPGFLKFRNENIQNKYIPDRL